MNLAAVLIASPASLLRRLSENWQAALVMGALLIAGWTARGVVSRVFQDVETYGPRIASLEAWRYSHEDTTAEGLSAIDRNRQRIETLEAQRDSLKDALRAAFVKQDTTLAVMRKQLDRIYCQDYPEDCTTVLRDGG